jgi:hypothetical protein
MTNTRNRKPDDKNKPNFWTRKTTLIPIFAFSTMTAIVGKDLFIDAPNNAPQSAPSSNVAQAPAAPGGVQTPPSAPALAPPEAVPALPPPPPSPADDPFSMDPAAHENFLYQLGTSESTGTRETGFQGGDYARPNFAGCLGRWQFCPAEIDGPGFGKYNNNREGWLHDPAYQNEQMEAYTRNHWNEIVRLGLTRFLGQTIPSSRGPVHVTATGMLGGSHLVGIGRLQEFLESGGRANRPDGGGITPADYMRKFENAKVPDDWVRMPGVQTASAIRSAPGPAV